MNIERIEQTLATINTYSDSGAGINRLAYTDMERQAVEYIRTLCENENMTVQIDAVGNLIARREGKDPNLPAVAFGSHIDTVYAAGKYDGILGVAVAIELILDLNEKDIQTEHPLELIVFVCEESARFGYSTLGSRAIAGTLKKQDVVDLQDKNGIYLTQEYEKYGLAIDKLEKAKRKQNDFAAFFELHIEQGPVLEKEETQIGIATGIAGSTRYKFEVFGVASHSGTTPMAYRKDALLGAAEIALALEEAALAEREHGTVATVGVFNVKPGAMNIIPGAVEINVDIRGTSETSKNRIIETLLRTVQVIEKKRHLEIDYKKISEQAPVMLNENIIEEIKKTCEEKGFSYKLMPSGAGHDAMNMAALCPTGLIFIPSKGGLSHNPAEHSSMEQIALGAELFKNEILKWARTTKNYSE